MFALAGFLAPILEELLFRGLLYKAWEKRLGWAGSMTLVSILFGLYHPLFWSAFASSIVFACLYRRTGSLWAPIIVHAIVNISLWYPLLGRHVLPRSPEAATDLSQWGLRLAALAVVSVALPWYVWLSRHRREPMSLPTPAASAHGALPQ
jgi:membrane protease YdiL (CAAX protease family)